MEKNKSSPQINTTKTNTIVDKNENFPNISGKVGRNRIKMDSSTISLRKEMKRKSK